MLMKLKVKVKYTTDFQLGLVSICHTNVPDIIWYLNLKNELQKTTDLHLLEFFKRLLHKRIFNFNQTIKPVITSQTSPAH